MAHVKPEKSEQFDKKCQVRLNHARISAPNDSGGRGNRMGRRTLKWSRGDLALGIPPAFCAFALAINFARSFEQLFKGDGKPVYLGP